ncbi:hypothetical protein H9P43_007991 [Blastocladiella emersonii ATCC 22665]|nr:hypothetical protein H9P43_007991 [Blastocladiella emersonii ATCC 22665]
MNHPVAAPGPGATAGPAPAGTPAARGTPGARYGQPGFVPRPRRTEPPRPVLTTTSFKKRAWLIKVPDWLAAHWKTAAEDEVLAVMANVSKTSSAPEFDMRLAESARLPAEVPRHLRLKITDADVKSMFVFDEPERGKSSSVAAAVRAEGYLVPANVKDPRYRALAKSRAQAAATPKRGIALLDEKGTKRALEGALGHGSSDGATISRVVHDAGPATAAAAGSAGKAAAAAAHKGPQRTFVKLKEDLVELFRQHTYWKFDGLVEQMGESRTFVRRALADVADHVRRGPYANYWMLKPSLAALPAVAAGTAGRDEDVPLDGSADADAGEFMQE